MQVKNLANDFGFELDSADQEGVDKALAIYAEECPGSDLFAEYGDLVVTEDLPGRRERLIGVVRSIDGVATFTAV